MSFVLALMLAASANPSPEILLERMRAAQSQLKTLTARLEQTKSYPQLGIEDPVEKGLLYVERGKLRVEMREPETRILVVKDGSYVLYQPRIRQAFFGKLDGVGSRGSFSALLAGSPEAARELSSAYEALDLGEENMGTRTVRHLKLRVRPGASVYCSEMELFIDTNLWLPVRQKCRAANDNEITVTLSDLVRDAPIPKNTFDLEIPKGVERIQGGGKR